MAIAFSCSECGKQYKVKDELAGRTVTCKDCSSPLRVPAVSPAPVTTEVENLAVEALVESKSEIAALPDQIEFECPRCVETVKVDAKFAGKQAQCPACKYPIRVPQLTDPKARNLRAADHKPTLAKRTDDPNLVGAWGNTTTTSIVSRDALEEADALRTRRIKPSVISRTMWIVIGALAAAAIALGFLLIRSHRTTKHRDDFMAKALALANETTVSPTVAAEVRRAAGEYRANDQHPNYVDANKLLIQAHERLPAADARTSYKAFERLLILTDIALSQAQLGGDAPARTAEDRIEWDKLVGDLRKTMRALVEVREFPMPDGMALAYERLARQMGMSGGKSPAILVLAGSNVLPRPEDQAEPLASIGLELVRRGDAGRTKAEELAESARSLVGPGQSMPKLIALHVVLDKNNMLPQVKAPTESEPAADVRLGFAEGLARRGEIDRARAVAQLPGRIEDRFAAQVLVAANIDAAAANPDFDACVSILEKDWGSRDLPDWSLIRLSQAIGRARATSVGARLFAWLQSQSPSGPHSQAVRAWAQYELLRNGAAPVNEETVQAMTPTHTAGSAFAWEALGRYLGVNGQAPSTLEQCPPAIRERTLAIAGIALGLLDSLRK